MVVVPESRGSSVKAVPMPLCVTVNVCPAIVTVPTRATPAFGRSVRAAVPLPFPEPLVTTSHGALLCEFHGQVDEAVMATLSDPPMAGATALVGTLTLQAVTLDVRTTSAHAAQSERKLDF